MYLLPLFKSLMQEVCSHMTERKREREGAHMCVVWRNEDPCTVMFKQRFPRQPHAPLVPLSKLRDEAPQLPLALMHAHTYAHARTHALLTLRSARVSQPLIEDRFVQMAPLHVEGRYEGVLISWLFD